MIVRADLREASTQPQEAELEHRQVEVDAESYETGRDQITADLPTGRIVASWRVERCNPDQALQLHTIRGLGLAWLDRSVGAQAL